MLNNFADISDVVLIWLVSCIGLIGFAFLAIQRSRRLSLAKLLRSEAGGTYSISILMVLPLFVTLLAVFVECNQLMLSKIALSYATFSAARSAEVWQSIDLYDSSRDARLNERCHFAAARALVPFVSSSRSTEPRVIDRVQRERAIQITSAYERQTGDVDSSSDYLAQKFYNACAATTVRVTPPFKAFATQAHTISVTVTYRAPFLLAGIGRLLGEKIANTDGSVGADYVRPISTTTELPIDFPLVNNPHRPTYSLGIRYGESL